MHDRKRHGAAAAKAHVRRELGRDATAATNVSPLPLPVFSSSAAASAADVARPSVHPGYSSCARACVRPLVRSPLFSRLCALSVDRSTLSPSFSFTSASSFVFGDFNAVLRTFDRVKVRATHRLLRPLLGRAVFEGDFLWRQYHRFFRIPRRLTHPSSPAFTDGGHNTHSD